MIPDLVGKTLGQYELVEIVGEGSLATVYKAYQPSLARSVAVKVLDSDDRKMLARFEREVKAVAQLHHPNILTVYEYGLDQGWPYIAMQFIAGGTLENYLTGQPLDCGQVVTLAIPIARALHHAHQHGLIHRDVKPSNILMPQPDWPLLADFGLVKVPNPDEEITGSDVALGTPAYIPPEQASAETVDPRADMYSLGVVMFQMITGRLPFEYKAINRVIWAHMSEPVPPPSKFNPDCPPELEEVILTALQKSPDDRYPNLQAMANALQRILSGSTVPLAGLPVEFPPPSPGDIRPRPDHAGVQGETTLEQEAQILLPDQNVTIDLPGPGEAGLIIGRAHSQGQVDIDLGPYGALEAGVSRRHARLIRQGTEWLIDDLGSMNGTYVDKKKINPGTLVPLKSGDLIRCSYLSFVFLVSLKT